MYRILTAILCVGTVLSAPQKDSNVTYVKRQTEPEPTATHQQNPTKTSNIEILPLTIPSITENDNGRSAKIKEPNKETPTYNYSDRIYSIKTKPKKLNKSSTTENTTPSVNTSTTEKSTASISTSTENTTPILRTSTTEKDILPSTAETIPSVEIDDENYIKSTDNIPAESILSDSIVKNETQYDAEITESDEFVTEKYEELTDNTLIDEEITKAPPLSFIPIPKLSHFGKSTFGSFSQNLLGNSGKRRFRSRCRCEKIWNCVKLQISVPRCPEEYFLCCS